MSKVGNKIISIPVGVDVARDGEFITVKGVNGVLRQCMNHDAITIEMDDKNVKLSRTREDKLSKSIHGLYRMILYNMVVGVSQGFERKLELIGVGYRVQKDGNGLNLQLGFSHNVKFVGIDGISFEISGDTKISVKGINKELVGQVAANIRRIRCPEVYKGKGVRYFGEKIKLKAGKSGKGKGK